MTDKQISALKYMIFNTKDGVDLSKRILAFLIDKSEGLTKEVCVSLVKDREGYTEEEISDAGYGVSAMESCNCNTHIHALMCLMGSELQFSFHYGDYDPRRVGDPFNTDGQFAGSKAAFVPDERLLLEGLPLRYTFWLSKESYSRSVELVVATKEKLEQIDLKKSGLYDGD